MEDEDVFGRAGKAWLEGGKLVLGEREDDAVGGAECPLEPSGGREAGGSNDEVAFVRAGIDVVLEIVIESVQAWMRSSLCSKFGAQQGGRVSNVEGSDTEDADGARMWLDMAWNAGKMGEERLIGFGDALVIGARAIGLDGEDGNLEAAFGEAGEGGEVGTDDGGDRGTDEGGKRKGMGGGGEGFGSGAELVDELGIAAEDGVHVAEGGADNDRRGIFFVEARFVEAAEVASTAASVDDDDKASEGIEDRGSTSVIGGKGGEVETEAFHDGGLLSCRGDRIGARGGGRVPVSRFVAAPGRFDQERPRVRMISFRRESGAW